MADAVGEGAYCVLASGFMIVPSVGRECRACTQVMHLVAEMFSIDRTVNQKSSRGRMKRGVVRQ